MAVRLESLKKALASLEDALRLYEEKSDSIELKLALQDSAIQRFEYTYELAWKAMQRWITENVNPDASQPVYNRKDLYRLAAKWGLIADPIRWFDYNQARNLTSHTYDEETAEQVFDAAKGLVDDVKQLIAQMERRND